MRGDDITRKQALRTLPSDSSHQPTRQHLLSLAGGVTQPRLACYSYTFSVQYVCCPRKILSLRAHLCISRCFFVVLSCWQLSTLHKQCMIAHVAPAVAVTLSFCREASHASDEQQSLQAEAEVAVRSARRAACRLKASCISACYAPTLPRLMP